MNLCPKCHAIFDGEKWGYDLDVYHEWRKKGARYTLCPGCERIERRRVDGIVDLRGNFLKEHREEAINLINNVAEKKKGKNIAARIFRIRESNQGTAPAVVFHEPAEAISRL